MSFFPDKAEEFVRIYRENSEQIRSFEGCHSVTLLNDVSDRGVFFTYSVWESEAALEKYRHSELFGRVWGSVKPLFRERAQAWSTHQVSF